MYSFVLLGFINFLLRILHSLFFHFYLLKHNSIEHMRKIRILPWSHNGVHQISAIFWWRKRLSNIHIKTISSCIMAVFNCIYMLVSFLWKWLIFLLKIFHNPWNFSMILDCWDHHFFYVWKWRISNQNVSLTKNSLHRR